MTTHEVYQLVVGEGGVSPEYFLRRMSVGEAKDYIKGLNRRHRQSWEMTRLLCRFVHGAGGGKNFDLPFSWENENGEEEEKREATPEELAALRARAREMEKALNKC